VRQIRLPARPVPASAKDPLPARRTPRHPSSLKPPPPATTVIFDGAPQDCFSAQADQQPPAYRPTHPSTPDRADGHDCDARQTPASSARRGRQPREPMIAARADHLLRRGIRRAPQAQVAAPNGG